MARKLKMGMIGGGKESFIGEVHRMAARLDNQIEMVCGALSSDPAKAKESGKLLNLQPDRCYSSYRELIDTEREKTVGERIDFISIVTPNHHHFEPALQALDAGFHVIIDKPLCFSVNEAYELTKKVKEKNLLFGVTYTYTGYPMVKQAKNMIAQNAFGKIRKVDVEYPQGWLSKALESEGQKQASWRTDPNKSGISGAIGDIGSHAENMAHYVTGLNINELCADLKVFVEGRRIDDDGGILIRYSNGATGTIRASQVYAGDENNLKITVAGEKGGLEWSHKDPSTLLVKWLDAPSEIYRAGVDNNYLSDIARNHSRLPSGHPEGFIEAFGNIYRNFAWGIQKHSENTQPDYSNYDFPTVEDGLRGMIFIETAVKSSKSGGTWMKFKMDTI